MSTPRVTPHVESFVATSSPAPDRVNFSSDGSRDEEEVPKASASSKDGDNRAPSFGAFARDEQAKQDNIGSMPPPNPDPSGSSTSVTGIGTGFNVYDYPDDPHGEVAGTDAQVWKIYMDESDSYLKERMEIWKNTIDMHLIFAGIFSVVLTGFVLQASRKMQPDYTQISALLLQELIMQLADTGGSQSSSGLPIVQSRPSHSQLDAWVNGLWFTSLSLSLMSTVLAMLFKQWLHHVTSFVSGTPQVRARIRHYRLTGIEKWHVPALIDSLPVIMNIAVILFFVGLIVFLAHLNIPVAVATAAVSTVTFSIYFASIILPFKYTHCPYKSPMTTCVHYLYVKGVHPLLERCRFLDVPKLYQAALSLESRESAEVDFLDNIKALYWLELHTPPNPTVKDIIMRSFYNLLSNHCPRAFHTAGRIYLPDIKMAVLSCLKDDTVIPSMETKLERLLRTFRQVEEKASLSMLSLQNIDFSGVTNPQLRVLFEVFHATDPTNSRDPHRRLNLILDYLSGLKRNVHQHPSIWEQLLNINLPNIPDQLHFAVVTEILSQVNATSIFADDGLNSRSREKYITASLPSSAPMPDIIHDIPEQGFLYLTRIFLDREMVSLAEISVTDCGLLLKSIMQWALMAPTCPGFKLMIREIMASLKQFSSAVPTSVVVPVFLATSHFMDIEIVEWHTRETTIELLRAAAPHLTQEYSESFYTNLLRLIMVDNNPQVHSISKHMPSIFRYLVPRYGGQGYFFDAIQKEDGLCLLGRTETSRDLLKFFDNYVTHVIRGLVRIEFWMDYVHRPQSLFLICRYTIIAGRDDLLLSFAQINSAASGWRQCIQELIQLIKDQESFNFLVELRFRYQPSEPQRKILDVVSDLKAILKLSSPEYDIPVDITEPEQNTQREKDDVDRSSSQIRRNSIDSGPEGLYPQKPDHSGIPMDDFQPPSSRWQHFGKTLRAFLNSPKRNEDHERWAASHP